VSTRVVQGGKREVRAAIESLFALSAASGGGPSLTNRMPSGRSNAPTAQAACHASGWPTPAADPGAEWSPQPPERTKRAPVRTSLLARRSVSSRAPTTSSRNDGRMRGRRSRRVTCSRSFTPPASSPVSALKSLRCWPTSRVGSGALGGAEQASPDHPVGPVPTPGDDSRPNSRRSSRARSAIFVGLVAE